MSSSTNLISLHGQILFNQNMIKTKHALFIAIMRSVNTNPIGPSTYDTNRSIHRGELTTCSPSRGIDGHDTLLLFLVIAGHRRRPSLGGPDLGVLAEADVGEASHAA